MSTLLEQTRLLVHPASARVVLGILRDGDDHHDLTKVVLADPALSAAVLRAANAAHLGYSRRIGGVRQAMVMLGGSLVGSLAASRVADLIFDASPPEYPDWYWLHSVAVASGASVLARHLGTSTDEAYSAGILHDIGSLLWASTNEDDGGTSTAAERRDAGAHLLQKWNMPERLVSSARAVPTATSTLAPVLTRVIVAAHALADALGVPSPDRVLSPVEALDLVDLPSLRLSPLLGEMESEIASVTSELTVER